MDFGNAALLIFIFVGLISEAKALAWGTNKERITVGIVNVVGIAAVFLVAESVWGTEQIIGGQQLGLLDWASRILVGVVLGGGASGLWQGFDTIKNVGENKPLSLDKVRANIAKFPDVHEHDNDAKAVVAKPPAPVDPLAPLPQPAPVFPDDQV